MQSPDGKRRASVLPQLIGGVVAIPALLTVFCCGGTLVSAFTPANLMPAIAFATQPSQLTALKLISIGCVVVLVVTAFCGVVVMRLRGPETRWRALTIISNILVAAAGIQIYVWFVWVGSLPPYGPGRPSFLITDFLPISTIATCALPAAILSGAAAHHYRRHPPSSHIADLAIVGLVLALLVLGFLIFALGLDAVGALICGWGATDC